LTLLAFALAAVPSAQASFTVGISDQQATTFSNSLYPALNLKAARYVAPYDVTSNSVQLGKWDDWYKAATKANQKILVSFEHSRTKGKEQKTPTVAQYKAAMKAFHTAYPSVKEINTWNEVNACQKGGRTERQPLGICRPSKAKLLVQFYGVDRQVFKGGTIIPVNVLDDKPTTAGAAVAYIKAFKKATKVMPKVWGIHNYSDTNRFSQVRTKNIVKAIGSKGQIWLLETGGQLNVFSGNESQKEAGAAKALGCMFYIAKHNPRIKRVYVYQFNGAPSGSRFDAGLVDFTGNLARPGYKVVESRTARVCKK
jgi:hypothetical protein